MHVRFVQTSGLTEHTPADVDALLERDDGFLWIDVPEFTDEAERVLERLGAHRLLVQACRERTFVPTVHTYPEHVFLVLHVPLAGKPGHVHLLELDQLVSARYLVTVHGPRNPAVPLTELSVETDSVRQRIIAGRFRPATPAQLSYALGSAIARRQGALMRSVAGRLPAMEVRVMASDFRHPEELLEELFLLRHELLVARTMAAQSREIWARVSTMERHVDDDLKGYAADLREQFDRARSVADGETQFLFGVIDLYQSRVTTRMTVAMERLAVIAAITLPVTAIASVYGMNVIVSQHTHVPQLLLVLTIMLGISLWLLRWARRQGWW